MDNNTDPLDLLEAQLLYCSIDEQRLFDTLIGIVDENDFYTYKKVFIELRKLNSDGKAFSYSVVKAVVPEVKDMLSYVLEDHGIGFTIFLSSKEFKEKAEELKQLSIKRQVENSIITNFDVEILKAKLEQVYKKGTGRWLTSSDLMALAQDILGKKYQNDTTYGISMIDKATMGIQKGQFIIVAGRPSVGKSVFLQQIALHNAKKGKKVLFVSIEMSEDMVVRRIISSFANQSAFSDGNNFNPFIAQIPSTFNVFTSGSIEAVEGEIKQKARDFDLICIDYIQMMIPKGIRPQDKLYERVTKASNQIKEIAIKYNIPIVAASQFSRQVKDSQPNLADLRESGALEQDADVVISLWKDVDGQLLLKDNEASSVFIDLLKNRNGYTFSNGEGKEHKLQLRKQSFTFYETI